MSPASARARSSSDRAAPAGGRLQSSARRDALLDAAVALVRTKGVHEVSMEAVAERAGVSRPLVYKHFANRDGLLAAAYRREASKLHAELASEVAAADSVEEMYRALAPRFDPGHGGARPDLHRSPGRRRVEPRHSQGAAIEGPRHGPGLRRRGRPGVRLGPGTFHVGHRRAVGRARCRPGAMATPSE